MGIFTADQKRILNVWVERLDKEAHEYKYFALVYTKYYYIFGGIAVTMLALFSTTGFIAINVCPDDNPNCETKLIVEWLNVGFDLMAAILIALFTFLNFGGHAEQCRTRKLELEALARTIEESFTYDETCGINRNKWIPSVKKQYDEIQSKQIVLGLAVCLGDKKNITEVHPLDKSVSGDMPGELAKSDHFIFKDKFMTNKIFRQKENTYQLDRLNDNNV